MNLKLLLGEPVDVPSGTGRVFRMGALEAPEPAVIAPKEKKAREPDRRPDGALRCRSCRHWWPATPEFFHVSKHSRYGFSQTSCKSCLKARTRMKTAQWKTRRGGREY